MIANFNYHSNTPAPSTGLLGKSGVSTPYADPRSLEPSFADYLEQVQSANDSSSDKKSWDPFTQGTSANQSPDAKSKNELHAEKKQKQSFMSSREAEPQSKNKAPKEGASANALEIGPRLDGKGTGNNTLSNSDGLDAAQRNELAQVKASAENNANMQPEGISAKDSPLSLIKRVALREDGALDNASAEEGVSVALGKEVATDELPAAQGSTVTAAKNTVQSLGAEFSARSTGQVQLGNSAALFTGGEVPTLIQVVDLRSSEGRLRALRAEPRAAIFEAAGESINSRLLGKSGIAQGLEKLGSKLAANQLQLGEQAVGKELITTRMEQLTSQLATRVGLETFEPSGALTALIQQLTRENQQARGIPSKNSEQSTVEQLQMAASRSADLAQARSNAVRMGSDVEAFKQALAEYLKTSGADELVRSTKFILRDNNRGQIKLILKPEALGQIKIDLSLDDKRIEGKIFVDNKDVEEAFRQTLDDILAAFREGGYETGEFQIVTSAEPGAVAARMGEQPVSALPKDRATAEQGYDMSSGNFGEMHINLSV